MGNFQGGSNRSGGFRGGNGGGGRPSFGGGRGGDSRGPVTMHKAVCDECHKNCEVPFRPSGDKPIYCSDCFGEKRGNEAPRREFNDRAPKRDFNDRPAQSSFAKPTETGPSMSDDTKKQLGEMNSKLDRLINAIEKLSQPKTVAAPAIKVAPIAAKIEAKKAPVAKVAIKKVIAVKAPAKKIEVKKVVGKKK